MQEDWYQSLPGFQITYLKFTTAVKHIFHLQVTANKPANLCDSIFLQIQEDICIFQGEDTLLRSYIWDNSWLHSHKNTHDFDITVKNWFIFTFRAFL